MTKKSPILIGLVTGIIFFVLDGGLLYFVPTIGANFWIGGVVAIIAVLSSLLLTKSFTK